MFERATHRIRRLAERRARERIAGEAERMREAAPPGIGVEASADGIRLTGRALRRRFALEPAVRWLTAVLR